MKNSLKGIYAAVVTPFDEKGHLQAQSIVPHLKNLAGRGCDGVLVSGTTGEGPSMTVDERIGLLETIRKADVNLRVLAGTGAASVNDAKLLTKAAFDMGCEGVVILPPFFFPRPSSDGLFHYYQDILASSTPSDGTVLLYHNPQIGAPDLDLDLIKKLRDTYPEQIVGIKDSSQSLDNAQKLIDNLEGFEVFVGDDRLLSRVLASGGAGAMTSLANLFPDLLRTVYESSPNADANDYMQTRLDRAYQQLDGVSRIAAIKKLLSASGLLEHANVRPPLTLLTLDEIDILNSRFHLHLEVPDEIDLALLLDNDPS